MTHKQRFFPKTTNKQWLVWSGWQWLKQIHFRWLLRTNPRTSDLHIACITRKWCAKSATPYAEIPRDSPIFRLFQFDSNSTSSLLFCVLKIECDFMHHTNHSFVLSIFILTVFSSTFQIRKWNSFGFKFLFWILAVSSNSKNHFGGFYKLFKWNSQRQNNDLTLVEFSWIW